MQKQQQSIYSKLESEIVKEKYCRKPSTDDRVTCVQITSVNTRHQPAQLIILLAGPFGDAVSFEEQRHRWMITTRQFRSAALKEKIKELNPKVRRRWTTYPFVLPHVVVSDILTTDSLSSFTGLSYTMLTPDSTSGDVVYTQTDPDYTMSVRFVSNCGAISLEIERDPGEALDPIPLERITQVFSVCVIF